MPLKKTKYVGKKLIREWREDVKDLLLMLPQDVHGRKRVAVDREKMAAAMEQLVREMDSYIEKDRAI